MVTCERYASYWNAFLFVINYNPAGFCNNIFPLRKSTTSFVTACVAGHYPTGTDTDLCNQCPVGWYSTDGSKCEKCAAGKSTVNVGSTAAGDCRKLTYSRLFYGKSVFSFCCDGLRMVLRYLTVQIAWNPRPSVTNISGQLFFTGRSLFEDPIENGVTFYRDIYQTDCIHSLGVSGSNMSLFFVTVKRGSERRMKSCC